jgi:AcrR family transcriptional regulator
VDPLDWNDPRVGAVLDAAESCFARRGMRRTTVEDIATTAQIARITVYRRVGNRDEVILATLLRVTDRFLRSTRRRLRRSPDLRSAMLRLIDETVRGARRDDLQLLYASEFHRVAGHPIPNAAPALFAMFGRAVADLANDLPGELVPGVTSDDAGEWVLRVILSQLSIPHGTGQDAVHAVLVAALTRD